MVKTRMVKCRTAATIAAHVLVLGAASGTAAADVPSSGSGTWQKHEYSFVSMGFTSTYSCDGLADKLKLLLLAAGARADAKAYPGACPSDFGHPVKLARADLIFYTLMPDSGGPAAATAPAPAAPTLPAPAAPTTPALPAQAPGPTDGTRAAGSWRTVVLSPRSPRDLALGDCELVDQFRAQVLPMFATRDIEDHDTCVPHQDSGSVIDLKFESFTATAEAKHP